VQVAPLKFPIASGDSHMASKLLSTVTEKAKTMAGMENAKVASMAADTKDVHDKNLRITSDFGVKQSNTDNWLSASTENKNGPMLLEDQFGREKVRLPPPSGPQLYSFCCSKIPYFGLTFIDPPLRPRAYSRACCARPWRRCLWQVHALRIRLRCHLRRCPHRHNSYDSRLPTILDRAW